MVFAYIDEIRENIAKRSGMQREGGQEWCLRSEGGNHPEQSLPYVHNDVESNSDKPDAPRGWIPRLSYEPHSYKADFSGGSLCYAQ